VSPEEIKSLRRAVGLTQRELADALQLEVAQVRDWEKGERFPTRAHCEAMEALRANPPPRKGRAKSPLELLADPAFFTLLRKLLAHPALRAEVEKLAAGHPDPLEDEDEPSPPRKAR
jgi:transcriptional regulator with XRE-family HTH domain